MAQPGQIRLKARAEFTSLLPAIKYEGQETIGMVSGLDDSLAERIVSRPTTGQRQVFNIAWDPITEELIIEVSEVDTV